MAKLEQIPEAILAVLRENPSKEWSESELVAAAEPRSGYSAVRVRNMVKVMVACGRVHGEKVRGSYSKIRHREDQGDTIDRMQKQIEAMSNQLEQRQGGDRVVEVKLLSATNKVLNKTEGLFHSEFETILDLMKVSENIFLYGPTGCGKTFVCSQAAEVMKRPFYFISCTTGMSEGQVGGRLNPSVPDEKALIDKYNQLVKQKIDKQAAATLASALVSGFQYICSEFIKAYEGGGVFLFDEFDAADPNVLLLVNAALANGNMAVPNRPHAPYAKRHKDFVCIAAANTVGTGADRFYSGRNKLDAATLDRFQIGKVYMDYDANVEQQLCPDPDLYLHLLNYRQRIQHNKLERAMSTRFMQKAYVMKTQCNWTHDKIDKSFFQGWRESETVKVRVAV